jgi:DNA mismatch repair protein MutL
MKIGLERGTFSVSGFVSAPGQSYSDKGRQEIFLNGRPIKNNVITRAIYDAYQSMIMKDRHPATILFINMDPAAVDVNGHPS